MLTKHYQALIRMNRERLAYLYEEKTSAKNHKAYADEHGLLELEYVWHNMLKGISKQIKDLVEIQKALKDTVRKHVMTQRDARWYKKAATERRENVLKRVVMILWGKCDYFQYTKGI